MSAKAHEWGAKNGVVTVHWIWCCYLKMWKHMKNIYIWEQPYFRWILEKDVMRVTRKVALHVVLYTALRIVLCFPRDCSAENSAVQQKNTQRFSASFLAPRNGRAEHCAVQHNKWSTIIIFSDLALLFLWIVCSTAHDLALYFSQLRDSTRFSALFLATERHDVMSLSCDE